VIHSQHHNNKIKEERVEINMTMKHGSWRILMSRCSSCCRGGAIHGKKIKKINDYRSTLRDFIQLCVSFRFRLIQISAKWCSGPPKKIKLFNYMSILRVFKQFFNVYSFPRFQKWHT